LAVFLEDHAVAVSYVLTTRSNVEVVHHVPGLTWSTTSLALERFAAAGPGVMFESGLRRYRLGVDR
jgi:hypothetical protein